jgi:hypothetical protein
MADSVYVCVRGIWANANGRLWEARPLADKKGEAPEEGSIRVMRG